MARIMAIDYGKKRVGLAVTDNSQIIASGLTTVAEKEVMDFLKDYLKTEKVEKFLLGYPLGLDGLETDATKGVEKFSEKLSKVFPNVPIVLVDERFTSKMAMQTLVQSGVSKKKRRNKALLDEVSATIMLQDYLYNET